MRRLAAAMLTAAVTASSLGFVAPAGAQSAQIDAPVAADQFANVFTPDARRAMAATPDDQFMSVLVRLNEQIDLGTAIAAAGPGAGQEDVIRALQDKAAHDQLLIRILAPIWESGPEVESFTPFWIMNGFAITATPSVITSIAQFGGIAEIDIERKYQVAGVAPTGAPTSNVAAIGAPAVWDRGYTGEGVVVAVLDTGVDMDGVPSVSPSEVADSYRGGTNSWFDPYGPSTAPYDPSTSGHGTSVTSIITSRDLSGSTIGVAPDAKWIAAKIFDDDGVATASAIHAAMQWALDPDADPSTDDGADVINASWTGGSQSCDTEFASDISVLRAAGVIPVFAAGNYGPLPGSSPSPSNLPGALAVGGVSPDLTALPESSRGPTDCDGASRTYPALVAPGENVEAQLASGQFGPQSGTSFAAPHVTGAIALLLSASPTSTDTEIEAALVGGASDLGDEGADNTFGSGFVDVGRSLDLLLADTPAAAAPPADTPPADPPAAEDDPSPVVVPVDHHSASISGWVVHDVDGDGAFSLGDLPTSGAQVSVVAAGEDEIVGTGDDFIAGQSITDADGSWIVTGLGSGIHRVSIETSTLPLGSVFTTAGSFDFNLNGEEAWSALFGWRPPETGRMVVYIYDDANGDGIRGDTEPGVGGVRVTVESAGADSQFGTADDGTTFVGATDALGVVNAPGLPPGPVRSIVDPATLPDRGSIGVTSNTESIIVPAGITAAVIAVTVRELRDAVAFVSLKRAGRVNGENLAFRDEDILRWDGLGFDMFFDGSDVGLAGRDVDAFDVLNDTTILLSLDRATNIQGLGLVEDSDVLEFQASRLGSTTRGQFSIFWRGSDIGLNGPQADIDSISLIDEGLLLSVRGNIVIDGLGDVRDEDLLLVPLTGPATPSRYFDGSEEGLQDRLADIDAASVTDSDIVISTLGTVADVSLAASDSDILSCGGHTSCTWQTLIPAGDLGLTDADVDGLALPKGSIR